MTQEKIDKERQRDEDIKRMLTQIDPLQKRMKDTCGVFRIKEDSYSSDSKLRER